MPPAPEFRDRFCHVGEIEVFRKTETENSPQADCHVAISRKIKIDLQSETNRPHPVKKYCFFISIGKYYPQFSKRIGNNHLFGKPGDETADAVSNIWNCVFSFRQICFDRGVPYYRPGDKLGEQGNIGGKVEQIFLYLDSTTI
jgi:hypothetical protein